MIHIHCKGGCGLCGWPPYIDVQVCRVDIKCNGG